MIKNKLIGYILIAVGLLHFIGLPDSVNISWNSLLIFLFIILGLSGTFSSIGNNRRITLFVSTIAFLFAIYSFVTEYYVLMNKSMIALPVVLFMAGAGFTMLYFDNPKEKVFLISGILLLLLSLLFTFVLNRGVVIGYANSMLLYVLGFWPGVLIIVGFLLLSSRYK